MSLEPVHVPLNVKDKRIIESHASSGVQRLALPEKLSKKIADNSPSSSMLRGLISASAMLNVRKTSRENRTTV
jgi:hypothetical protein